APLKPIPPTATAPPTGYSDAHAVRRDPPPPRVHTTAPCATRATTPSGSIAVPQSLLARPPPVACWRPSILPGETDPTSEKAQVRALFRTNGGGVCPLPTRRLRPKQYPNTAGERKIFVIFASRPCVASICDVYFTG